MVFDPLMILILAQSDDGSAGGSLLGLLLPFLLLGAVFYFVFIVPQRRRMKSMEALRRSIDVGDEVRTIGGIFGTVRSIEDDTMTIDVGAGTTLRIARRAVAAKIEEAADD